METEDILAEITPIFRKILVNNSIVLKKETTARDIEEWDSLTHIQLIVAMEKFFKIKFASSEIRSLNNIGSLCEVIKNKTQ